MTVKDTIIDNLSRISTVEGLVFPFLKGKMKREPINPSVQNRANGATNLWDFWESTCGNKFFKMGMFIRLGSEAEKGFKEYYMDKAGITTHSILRNNIKQGTFQRLTGNRDNLQDLFKSNLIIDLELIPEFKTFKEFMLSRHIYTHNCGLLDDKYISDWLTLTGEDLSKDNDVISAGYPTNDIYWFRPLKKIWDYHSAIVSIFRALPP